MYKPGDEKELLAQNLRLFCKTNNLTHSDAAAFIGVSESVFNNWLSGRSLPNQTDKTKLEKVFKTSYKKICSNIVTLRLIQDLTFTIEDIFPYNCIIAACNWTFGTSVLCQYEDSTSDDFDMSYRDITPSEFDAIFSTNLNYREQGVIEMRYRDSLTLDEVGDKFNITRERVRQIEAKSLRKIYRGIQALKHKKNQAAEDRDKLNEKINILQKAIVSLKVASNTLSSTSPGIIDTPIEDLDLSVRAYNCLKRAKLNTIKDIVTYEDSLLKVRNLGRAALEEVVDKIAEVGLSDCFKFDDDVNHFIAVSEGRES